MASSIFGFPLGQHQNTGAQPPQAPSPVPPPRQVPQFNAPPDPMQALFVALARAMQEQSAQGAGRLQLQRDQTFGQHLGMGGQPISPTNPQGHAGGDPFTNGFFKSGASQLTPDQIMASQGGNAINQWKRPDLFPGQMPGAGTQADAAVAASPPMFQLDPSTAAMAGITPPPPALGDERLRKGSAFSFGGPRPPQKPGNFGAGGSPKKGFSFGF